MGLRDGRTPPDDDREFLATLRRGGCTGHGRHTDEVEDERTPLAEAVLGLAFLVTVLLAVYGLWAGARDLFRLIH